MAVPTKILVVDDQALVRRTLCSMRSEQSDWKIYEAENGKIALDRVREIKPDVIVLDIVMPEMNGIQAAYEVRRQSPETKIILMSSYDTPQEATFLAHPFGDGNFIEKSETGRELIPAISRFLSEGRQAH